MYSEKLDNQEEDIPVDPPTRHLTTGERKYCACITHFNLCECEMPCVHNKYNVARKKLAYIYM